MYAAPSCSGRSSVSVTVRLATITPVTAGCSAPRENAVASGMAELSRAFVNVNTMEFRSPTTERSSGSGVSFVTSTPLKAATASAEPSRLSFTEPAAE